MITDKITHRSTFDTKFIAFYSSFSSYKTVEDQ